MDIKKLILKSSNKNKINEFKRILGDSLTIESGIDLPEVDSNPLNVIIYKAIEAGENVIVEDTTLIIDGKEIVDIKWKINELSKINKKVPVVWRVLLGVFQEEKIYIFEGIVNGIIITDPTVEGYGFDTYFLPDGSDITLAQLDKDGEKDNFSARKIALINLLKNRPIKVIDKKLIEQWTML